MSLSERFWAKVDKNGPVHPVLGTRCWIWTAARSPRGYGKFNLHGRNRFAHRVVHYLVTGKKIPDSKRVCHHCDNNPCVNPDHHFVGQQRDNILDCIAKGRFRHRNTAKTHCPQGHAYTPKNTWVDKAGSRHCRECWRSSCRARPSRRSA